MLRVPIERALGLGDAACRFSTTKTDVTLPFYRAKGDTMNISVSGKNMDTGSAFQVHAETALNDVVNKYFDRAVSGL